jgi:hypothetical protein
MSKKWDDLNNRQRITPKKTWEEKTAHAPQIKSSWDEKTAGIPPRPKKTTEEIIKARVEWDGNFGACPMFDKFNR